MTSEKYRKIIDSAKEYSYMYDEDFLKVKMDFIEAYNKGWYAFY